MNDLWGLLAGLAGGVIVSALMPSPKAPKQQTLLAQQPAATPQGQAARAPDYNAMQSRNQQRESAGPMAGPSSTFLTGPAGVDPTKLKLGRTTLLGA